MKIFELDQDGGVLMAAVRKARAAQAARTGLHCSTIVNDMARLVDPKKYEKDFADKTRLAFQEVGNTLEDILAAELARRQGWRKPEPQTYRGIICSPDGWQPRTRTIDEMKATWVTERDFLTSMKFQIYKWQILMYMLAWGADRARLHVLFIAGTYRPPFPNARTFVLKPTPRDLRENYATLRQHAIDQGWLSRKGSD